MLGDPRSVPLPEGAFQPGLPSPFITDRSCFVLQTEGPRWVKGFTVNLCFAVMGFTLTLAMSVYYRLENRRRDRVEGGPPPKGQVLNVIEEHDRAHGESPTFARLDQVAVDRS